MIKSFEGFFNMGRLLDSASFKDGFTRKLLSYFDEITCIETSDIDCRSAYSSDTLERAAVAVRLKVIHRLGGVLMCERVGQTRISFAAIVQMLELEKFCLRWTHVLNP
ncbi:hypothetical protein [Methylobacter sp. YRD-M1]|uniref:hypothetical protein n=1 Tax=Methylobacter sp. YRD-M1 TaxID=2911520 RepID=UPI00227C1682|nr:hypothetical protein [Methylobacter sp. YRD-M1]WAK00570.1 hypothetical protein LZ558_11985 [Methylobacter sp. YRD-M1]